VSSRRFGAVGVEALGLPVSSVAAVGEFLWIWGCRREGFGTASVFWMSWVCRRLSVVLSASWAFSRF
jgi:hypothetical protein